MKIKVSVSMSGRRRVLALLVLLSWQAVLSPLRGTDLEWRVSIKVVLDENEQRASTGDLNEDSEICAAFERANLILDSYGRGYRFKIVEITNVYDLPLPPTTLKCCEGGANDGFEPGCDGCPDGSNTVHGTTGTTNTYRQWFDVPSYCAGNALYDAATADPETFRWRTDALNVYIVGSDYSGVGGDIGGKPMVLGQNLHRDNTPFHEMGHTFGLDHTHGGNGRGSEDETTPGDDGICDTLPDNSEWKTQDAIATNNFDGRTYSELNPDEQQQVDDMLYNLMAYHTDYQLLTQGQLDVMTDNSNQEGWPSIVNGRTWFVDTFASGCACYTPIEFGSSTQPYHTVARGLAAAESGDIVLIRPGQYDERLTISQHVILRAPRDSARIGSAH